MTALEMAGRISGIGGLGMAVFLLVCRQIIRTVSWPKPTKDQAYRLLNRMIVLAFVLGVVGAFAWVASAVATTISTNLTNAATQAAATTTPAPRRRVHRSPLPTTDVAPANPIDLDVPTGSARSLLGGIEVASVAVQGGDRSDPDRDEASIIYYALETGRHLTVTEILKANSESPGAIRRLQAQYRRILVERCGVVKDKQTYRFGVDDDGRYYLLRVTVVPPTTLPAGPVTTAPASAPS